jgi:hypothetical protein
MDLDDGIPGNKAISDARPLGDPTARAHTLYAPLLPEPVSIGPDAPTGLLSLAADPRGLGRLHGVLVGLAYPRIEGTPGTFLAGMGPDAELTSTARAATVLRELTHWVEAASRKATVPSDRAAVLLELDRARERAAFASSLVEPVREAHRRWHADFEAASDPAMRLSRRSSLIALPVVAFALCSGPISFLLWWIASFLAVGMTARIVFERRFDRHVNYDIKGPLYAERSRDTGSRAVEMLRRGLAFG